MSKVTIVPVKGQTGLLNLSKSSSDGVQRGFLKLEQGLMEFGKGWAEIRLRTALIKGTIPVLESILRENPKKVLDGRIVVEEFLESDVPDDLAKEFFNKALVEAGELEEAMLPYFKTSGGANPMNVTKADERIVRFAYYDQSGEGRDKFVKHDNYAELSAHSKAEKALAKLQVAVLPGAEEEQD